ncbi:MAG: hypothetical protein KKD01_19855 [Proteobacteria bacterium]|nr:hypothetical protein [Pseudomonadota bacterium]MBU1456976.1 hypothetical protein [Pseudomonadota bacterium]
MACGKIKTRKKGNYIHVIKGDDIMWTENLDVPLRSFGATRFRKYAKAYMRKHPNG